MYIGIVKLKIMREKSLPFLLGGYQKHSCCLGVLLTGPYCQDTCIFFLSPLTYFSHAVKLTRFVYGVQWKHKFNALTINMYI